MTPQARTERMLDRLRELVMIETPSSDAERLRTAHMTLQRWGDEALGRPGEEVLVEGVPHLWWDSTAERRVLLLGHVDTVFGVGTTSARPFTVTDDRATGPGVFDMKSGLVVAFAALGLAIDTSNVAVLITGDEEVGSLTSRALVEDAATGCSAVLVLEPSLDGALKTARKGGSIYKVAFNGRAAHAGLEPELGSNALVELARFVEWCGSVADSERGTSVTPTVAQAGTATNVVPASAELVIDVRAGSLAELERVHAALSGRASVDPGVEIVVRGGVNRPPLEPHVADGLVELARKVAARSGLEPIRTASVGGASDANFTAAVGVATLDGLGPTGGGAHSDDEWVRVSSLDPQARLVAGLIDELTGAR